MTENTHVADGVTKKLSVATSFASYYGANPYGEIPENIKQAPGLHYTRLGGSQPVERNEDDYLRELRQCRFFYRYDPIASSVINRMTELAVKSLKLRRGLCTDKELAYFRGIVPMLTPLLRQAAREFLVSGMAIPDFTTERKMGNRIHPSLGRTRFSYPSKIWLRNPELILLKRRPMDLDRGVYVKISDEERYFILNNGTYRDGTKDVAAYNRLVREYPEYVKAVKDGQRAIPLEKTKPIYRKLMTFDDWPQPYLVPALTSLKHKMRIKEMDYSIANRAIEAIRLIKAGDKDFPITEDDDTLTELRARLSERNPDGSRETIYTLFANHTVTAEWVYPPLDALLSDAKYSEPNSDIFLALGFSRVLLVGESLRSNSSQNVSSSLGPASALEEMRDQILEWVVYMFERLAEENGFDNIPDVTFPQIQSSDLSALAQFAVEAAKLGAISKDTVARIFNSDFITENEQVEFETESTGFMSPYESEYVTDKELAKKQQESTDKNSERDFQLREKIANKPTPAPTAR